MENVVAKSQRKPESPFTGRWRIVSTSAWESALTEIVRWTWGAAVYRALPAWLASIVQVPDALKVTEAPDTAHTPGPLPGSTENLTGLPEPPPVADRCAEPPGATDAGAVKEIDWAVPDRVV